MDYSLIPRRQTADLDICSFVSWDNYNWHDIVQCNTLHNGITLHWNPAVFCLIAASHSAAVVLGIQIIGWTLLTFRSWRTLYFWSLIAAASGLVMQTIALDLLFFAVQANNKWLGVLTVPGNIFLKTGYALILYSRLHHVVPNNSRRLLRTLLAIIISVGVITHVPQIAGFVAAGYSTTGLGYRIYKVVMYLDFCTATESIFLSALYIYYFQQNLKDMPARAPDAVKAYTIRTFRLLVMVYIFELIYQTVTLTLLCLKLILARHTVDPPIYGIKLATELFVLTRLVRVAKMRSEILQRGNISATMVEDVAPDDDSPTEKKPAPARGTVPSASPSMVWGTNVGGRGMDIDVFQTVGPHLRSVRDEASDRVSDSASSEQSTHQQIQELERHYLGRSNTGVSESDKVERYYFGVKSVDR